MFDVCLGALVAVLVAFNGRYDRLGDTLDLVCMSMSRWNWEFYF